MAPVKWIGLIEDSDSRVAWLKALVEPHYAVVHGPRVTTWFDKLTATEKALGPAEGLIFDHDLGIGSFEDVDGNNGMDALVGAAKIPSRWKFIWSTNDDARARMLAWCRSRQYVSKAIPFKSEHRDDIACWLTFHLKLPGHERLAGRVATLRSR